VIREGKSQIIRPESHKIATDAPNPTKSCAPPPPPPRHPMTTKMMMMMKDSENLLSRKQKSL